jgi:short-subunit dehydrogenase
MKTLENKTVLLTGASRGIGHDLACAIAKEGGKLVIVAHPWHEEDLRKVRGLPTFHAA